MRFAIYCRKSKYTGRGESVQNQLDYCLQYIDLTFKDTSPHEVHTYLDEGYSGKDLDRPSFKRMLKDCYANLIDYVVVYRLDRVSRNVSDFANLYQELVNLGIGFISTSERYDTSTSGGRAMLFMACVFAQLERETLSERVKDNMYSLAKSGRWLGGITPTGYTSTSYIVDGKTKFKLTPNSDLQIIHLMFKKYLESHSISAVERYLFESRIESPKGNLYSRSSIKTILENPVYCQSDSTSFEYLKGIGCNMFCTLDGCNSNGYIVYGRTSTVDGKSQKRVVPSSWIVSIGEHLGVVQGIDWVDVQKSLHRKDYRSKSIHNSNSLLSGSIYCPLCNSKMISRTKRKGFVYACSNKLSHGTKVCNSSNVDGSLDDAILKKIFTLVHPNSDVVPQLENLKKDIRNGTTDIQRDIISKKLSKDRKLLLHLDENSLAFKEISKEYEKDLTTLNTIEYNLSLKSHEFNIHNFLLEEFKLLPIRVKRDFLKEIFCSIKIVSTEILLAVDNG